MPHPLPVDISECVSRALAEDIGSGDLTAALIDPGASLSATLRSREPAVLCGTAWFDEVFRQLDTTIRTEWLAADGDAISSNQVICKLTGPARGLLTGERTALNFLQTLSGTASVARHYADMVAGTGTRILDTRKTLPGLRNAQKYATLCGGCSNHRMGLYDGILIKENHIAAAGGIGPAVIKARQSNPHVPVECEVENLEQLDEALAAGADIVLLDNFSLEELAMAVQRTAGRAKLEASGGLADDDIRAVAATGVDFISVGALTKHVHAIDLSMRFDF